MCAQTVSGEESQGTYLEAPENMKHVCVCCDEIFIDNSRHHPPPESDVVLLPFSYRPRPKDVFRGNIDNPAPTHIQVWLCPEHKKTIEEQTCDCSPALAWSGWDWWDVADGIDVVGRHGR